MRAISVRGLWAMLIALGYKNPENRTSAHPWHSALGSDVLIHQALAWDPRAEKVAAAILNPAADDEVLDDLIDLARFRAGQLLCVATLVDVHDYTTCDDERDLPELGDDVPLIQPGLCSKWAQRGAVHLDFQVKRLLPPGPVVHGQLGLWTPPRDVLDQLEVA